jgi:hypothetical protein
MATATTGGTSRHQRNLANTRRANASTPRPTTKPWTVSFPRGDGLRYAFLAGKSIAAAVFVFAAICALIYTSASPRKTMHAASEKQKTIARQKTTTADKSAAEAKAAPEGLGSALVSKIDLPIRDAPRRDAKILNRAVYGSHVEVLGQDGTWVQVRAAGQNVTGWVEKAGLNF